MAILLNIISSGSRKSAGAATFRRVRGRTIMSQKRGGLSASALETRAAAGLIRSYREALFYIMTSFCAGMANSIKSSFEPTKYGSSRNAFFKLNYSAVEAAVNGTELGLALLDQLMHNVSFTGVTVTSQEAGSRSITAFDVTNFDTLMNNGLGLSVVRATRGGYVRYVAGGEGEVAAWSDYEDPTGSSISAFEVAVTTATTSGQRITSVTVTSATNFTPSANIEVAVSTQVLQGSWTGNTFTVSESPYFSGNYTVRIRTTSGEILAERLVTFYSSNNEASGE